MTTTNPNNPKPEPTIDNATTNAQLNRAYDLDAAAKKQDLQTFFGSKEIRRETYQDPATRKTMTRIVRGGKAEPWTEIPEGVVPPPLESYRQQPTIQPTIQPVTQEKLIVQDPETKEWQEVENQVETLLTSSSMQATGTPMTHENITAHLTASQNKQKWEKELAKTQRRLLHWILVGFIAIALCVLLLLKWWIYDPYAATVQKELQQLDEQEKREETARRDARAAKQATERKLQEETENFDDRRYTIHNIQGHKIMVNAKGQWINLGPVLTPQELEELHKLNPNLNPNLNPHWNPDRPHPIRPGNPGQLPGRIMDEQPTPANPATKKVDPTSYKKPPDRFDEKGQLMEQDPSIGRPGGPTLEEYQKREQELADKTKPRFLDPRNNDTFRGKP